MTREPLCLIHFALAAWLVLGGEREDIPNCWEGKKGIRANYAKINALVISILQIRLIHLIVTKRLR